MTMAGGLVCNGRTTAGAVLLLWRSFLQSLDLLLVVGTMAGHPLDHLRDGNISVQLGMECRFLKISRLQATQQLHVGMTIQPIERNQFCGRSLHVAEISGPVILVDG